jgi:hypothetical protein
MSVKSESKQSYCLVSNLAQMKIDEKIPKRKYKSSLKIIYTNNQRNKITFFDKGKMFTNTECDFCVSVLAINRLYKRQFF